MAELGKLLIILGLITIGLGILFLFWGKIPYFGKLPGDIVIKKGNFVFYFPITTSIVVSVVLSLILYFISKIK